ncbi:MAG: universal stress protein [Geminicoccaceae bacterium]
MSIKRILVPITEIEDLGSMTAAAISVARLFKGHVQFLYQRDGGAEQHDLLSSFGSLNMNQFSQLLEHHSDYIEKRAQDIRAHIEDQIQIHGLAYQETPSRLEQPSASLCEIDEPITDFVSHFGGVSDLIVVGQPSKANEQSVSTVIGAALFASGRPVLMAPPAMQTALDQKVVIGWNRSIQAGRGVASALPFLLLAKAVEIVSVVTGAKRGPSAEDLADYLTWHGVGSEVKEIPPEEHRAVGDILLKTAEKSGADLLVMGAYSHSRLREMLLGGVTKHILSHANLPVLMAH